MTMVSPTQLEAQIYQTAKTQVSFDTNVSSNSTLIDHTPPKKPLAELNIVNPLASIVHQTDRNGNRQPILTGARRVSREVSIERKQRGGFRNIFTNIWSAFGLIDQELDLDRSKQGASFASKGSTIELRSSLLPPLSLTHFNKKCLVLDLDETLVHSSFKPTDNYDFIVPVEIDGVAYTVFVCKRPGAERFLIEMAKYYELVVYTASLSNYADPLLDILDPEGVISHRLYREHCVQFEGDYVKDLSLLDRDISQTIIVDNSPRAYSFHPQNAIGCSSFIDDLNDSELKSIALFLTKNHDVEDVRDHLHMWNLDY